MREDKLENDVRGERRLATKDFREIRPLVVDRSYRSFNWGDM